MVSPGVRSAERTSLTGSGFSSGGTGEEVAPGWAEEAGISVGDGEEDAEEESKEGSGRESVSGPGVFWQAERVQTSRVNPATFAGGQLGIRQKKRGTRSS